MRYLKQNTAATIVIGLFIDYGTGKELLSDNSIFDPTDLICELIKGSTSSELTLSKTGGANDINLTGKGMATFEIAAGNVDALGQFRLSFTNATPGGISTETILPFAEDFEVLPANVYDSMFGSDKLEVVVVDNDHVWHVAKTGNNSNGGHSFGDALLTIGQAVTNALSGDTIKIWPGDYVETVTLTGKSITLEGTSRYKSRIYPTAHNSGIILEDNCTIKNLTVKCQGSGVSNDVAIYGTYNAADVLIEDCDLVGSFDGVDVGMSSNIVIRNCYIKGDYDGLNCSRAKNYIVETCIIETTGTYAGSPYGYRALLASGDGILSNCILKATSSINTSIQKVAACEISSVEGCWAVENCVFLASGTGSHTGPVYGLYNNHEDAKTSVANSGFRTSGNGTVVCDIANSAGIVVVAESTFDTSKTSGTITQGGSGFEAAVNAQCDIALSDISLGLAAKVLTNKTIQNKSTGMITVYDDDGVTPVLYLTPSDDGTDITLTPSMPS